MDYKALGKQIKEGAFAPVYLLYGEERFLAMHYEQLLIEKVLGAPEDDFNTVRLDREHLNAEALYEAVEACPLTGGQKVVLVKDSGLFQKANANLSDALLGLCERGIPPYTMLIFSETEISKKKEFQKLIKAIEKEGEVVEFSYLPEAERVKWAAAYLGKAGKQITKEDAHLAVAHTAEGLASLKNELDKLIAYAKEDEWITREAIQKMVRETPEGKIFLMFDCLIERKGEQALKILKELQALHEAESKVVIMLSRFVADMCALMKLEKSDFQEIVKTTGMRDFAVRKGLRALRGRKKEELSEMLSELAAIDEGLKNRPMVPWVPLEDFLLKYGS